MRRDQAQWSMHHFAAANGKTLQNKEQEGQ
jgi:hypothetical protein